MLIAGDQLPRAAFTSRTVLMPKIWSACEGKDGEVPPIRVQTTLFIEGEDSTGWVGQARKGGRWRMR